MSRLDVLVVDDSAVIREAMRELLEAQRMLVRTASDPVIAVRRIAERVPDVLLLDIEMPRMDGITFLRKLMSQHPIPTVVFSAIAAAGSRNAVEALAAGAVDVLEKPKIGDAGAWEATRVQFSETLRAAAAAHVGRARGDVAAPKRALRGPSAVQVTTGGRRRAVAVVGVSTGGPQALEKLLAGLTPGGVPLAIVQHMPAAFTGALAQRLDKGCCRHVREAAGGEVLAAGDVLVAPGDRHMELRRRGEEVTVVLRDGAPVGHHKPSVDVLFASSATYLGDACVGVLLTGMGADGARGLAALCEAGAATIAQDEATSVVFGMPREAILLGAAELVLPISTIGATIERLAAGGAR